MALMALLLVVSACSPSTQAPSQDSEPQEVDGEGLSASTTPAASEVTLELTTVPTKAPTEIPLTPTSSPTPAAPSGTLTLAGQYGYGSGLVFEPTGMRLSADEKRLIVPTTAGIFIYSAEDLSPISAIYNSLFSYKDFFYSRNVGISRDGTLAVTHSEFENRDRVLRIWDLNTGNMVNEFVVIPGESTSGSGDISDIPTNEIVRITITPDNRQAALVFEDGLIWVINLNDGTIAKKIDWLVNDRMFVNHLVFDPEGKNVYFIYSLDLDTFSRLFDGNTWQEKSTANGGIGTFGAFSPVRSASGFMFGYFAFRTGSGKMGIIRANDYSTLLKRFEIDRGADIASAVAFSPDGSMVVMGGETPPELELWAVDAVKGPEQTFPVSSPVWSVASSSNGENLYGITDEGALFKWINGQPDPVASRDGFWRNLEDLQFSEDGKKLLLFTNYGQSTRLYWQIDVDVDTGDVQTISPSPLHPGDLSGEIVSAVAISPDKSIGAYVPVVDLNSIQLFDPVTGGKRRVLNMDFTVIQVDFTADGKSMVVSGYDDGPILKIVDVGNGYPTKEFPVEDEFPEGMDEMRFSGDKSVMVLEGGSDGYTQKLMAYNTDTFELLGELELDNVYFLTVGVSNDGGKVAIVTQDGKLLIWDVPANKLLPEYDLRNFYGDDRLDTVFSLDSKLAFSPDDSQLALSTNEGVIRVFDIAP
jgi:WD40 repeat protein